MPPIDLNRREMLKSLVGMTAALMAPGVLQGQATQPSLQPVTRDKWGELLPQRRLGANGPFVTMLGVGGAHLVDFQDEATCQKTIETAIAGGVRFFEMAILYGNGVGEERYGKFLTPKYREQIFLMTKPPANNAVQVKQQLEDSLRRLKTDYLDLWQMHNISTVADADRRTAAEIGAIDYLVEAREKGIVKRIGFTGHLNTAVHSHMLDRLKERNIQINTIQMPINAADPSYSRSFILQVLPRAVEMGLGVIAMKTLANGGFFGGSEGYSGPNPRIIPDRISVAEAMHFVWSLPVSVALTGAHSPEMLQEKIDAAKSFKPLSEQQRNALIAKVADLGGTTVEAYKSDTRRGGRAALEAARRASTMPTTRP